MEMDRYESDGPRRINNSLKFMEDVYSVSFIYQFKRKYIEGDFSDIEEEEGIGEIGGTSINDKDHEKRVSMAKSFTDARVTLRGRFLFMFLTQMILTGLLFEEQVLNACGQANYKEKPTDIWITLSRFFCGNVMHFWLQNEIEQGLQMMKFALNHSYKFRSWRWAFSIGFS